MTRRLRSLLGRRSSWTRQAVVAVVALVLLSVVASALTTPPRSRQPSRPKTVGASSPASTGSGRFAPHASMVEVARAREAAARFLERYLPFVYGRASASSVAPVTPGLRRELAHERAPVTPVERRRHPRVVSLDATEQRAGVALATALVDDGGITTYALTVTLRDGRGGWVVSGVVGG